ncbi:MAG: galactokinase [Actinomycetota bacterium]
MNDPSSTAVVHAPGRVNLIGEHTDYNDGFVLPAAIDRYTTVEAERRADRLLHVESLGETDDVSLDALERTGTWRDYVRGVARELASALGASLTIESDVPQGVGLSSSAALEVAVGRALDASLAGEDLAVLCRRAENEFVGVPTGIMDQFASALGRAGHALLLDCRDLSHRHVSIPDGLAIVVCDSRLERRLASSGYADRRRACEAAAALLGVPALRDATPEQVETLPHDLRPRARHVVTENARTPACAEALEAGDLAAVGALMLESHASLRDDFEVVPPEIDAIATAVRAVGGCRGARMTGGGFGGCVVALVERDAVEAARSAAEALGAVVHVCRASDGVQRHEGPR